MFQHAGMDVPLENSRVCEMPQSARTPVLTSLQELNSPTRQQRPNIDDLPSTTLQRSRAMEISVVCDGCRTPLSGKVGVICTPRACALEYSVCYRCYHALSFQRLRQITPTVVRITRF
mmetsp:Transcript_4727/g.7348  ORF Transcript_4727/g.7348 Transcript_4727/m.7348 type:complete len:118 (+) Transcript_4727:187-540(+)